MRFCCFTSLAPRQLHDTVMIQLDTAPLAVFADESEPRNGLFSTPQSQKTYDDHKTEGFGVAASKP